jgi:hypothetical protein
MPSATSSRTDNPTDHLETLLLMLLDSKSTSAVTTPVRRQRDMGVLENTDQGTLLKFRPAFPHSAYTADAADSERLYSPTMSYLVQPPHVTLGQGSEMVLIDPNSGILKWTGYRRINKPAVRLAVLGRAAYWYEAHYRMTNVDGKDEYFRRLIPISESGKPLLAKCQSHPVCGDREIETLFLTCSLIEDAHRAGAMLCSVRAESTHEIKFPIALSDYQSLFSGRDAPLLPSGRRKALLHWVSRYLRKSSANKLHTVKRHTRGTQEFDIDGLHITLTPNDAP